MHHAKIKWQLCGWYKLFDRTHRMEKVSRLIKVGCGPKDHQTKFYF